MSDKKKIDFQKLKGPLAAAILALGSLIAGAVGGPWAKVILTGSKAAVEVVEQVPPKDAPASADTDKP